MQSGGARRRFYRLATCVVPLLCACSALAQHGSIVTWGNDPDGLRSRTPANAGFLAAAAGPNHCVAIRSDNSLISWGNNSYGVVSNTPATGAYTAVSGGVYHSTAIRVDKTLVAWGDNTYGQVSTPVGTY